MFPSALRMLQVWAGRGRSELLFALRQMTEGITQWLSRGCLSVWLVVISQTFCLLCVRRLKALNGDFPMDVYLSICDGSAFDFLFPLSQMTECATRWLFHGCLPVIGQTFCLLWVRWLDALHVTFSMDVCLTVLPVSYLCCPWTL